MKPASKSYFFAGLAVLFWSTVATAFKISLRELDFIQLIYIASFVTVLILFTFLLFSGKVNLIFRQTYRQYINSAFLGAMNPMLYYLVLFKAYSLLPAQVAQPLNMVWPIVLALLSVPLLGQKIGIKSITALFVSFLGVIIISSQGDPAGYRNTNFTGALLALSSSVIWSLYWILNVRDKRDEIVKLFLNFFFGLIFLSLCMAFFSDFRINIGLSFYAAVYVGIFEAGIVYVFWMKALQLSSNNARIGNLIFLSPFISLVFIRFILKETLFITTFAGLIFIVAGIFLQQLDEKSGKSDG